MIQNDRELEAARQRIEQFQNRLGQMRQNAEPRDLEAMAGGYRLEIERMQAEVMSRSAALATFHFKTPGSGAVQRPIVRNAKGAQRPTSVFF